METEKKICKTCNAFDTEYCPFAGCVNESTTACDDYLSDECESCKVGD